MNELAFHHATLKVYRFLAEIGRRRTVCRCPGSPPILFYLQFYSDSSSNGKCPLRQQVKQPTLDRTQSPFQKMFMDTQTQQHSKSAPWTKRNTNQSEGVNEAQRNREDQLWAQCRFEWSFTRRRKGDAARSCEFPRGRGSPCRRTGSRA